MAEQCLPAESLLRVFLDKALDERHRPLGQVLRVLDHRVLDIDDPVFGLLSADVIEGCLAHQ